MSFQLLFWMRRVSALLVRARQRQDIDTIHDLRTALRHCRTISSALGNIRSSPDLDQIHRVSKKLFKKFGGLRDTHVGLAWLYQLSSQKHPAPEILIRHLNRQEKRLKQGVIKTLGAFPAEIWEKWGIAFVKHPAGHQKNIPATLRPIVKKRLGSYLDAHVNALHTNTYVNYHYARIKLKKFRYLIENFYPKERRAWGKQLKKLQDLLGEAHDFHVLQHLLRKHRNRIGAKDYLWWKKKLENEGDARLAHYRKKFSGPRAPDKMWRRHFHLSKRSD